MKNPEIKTNVTMKPEVAERYIDLATRFLYTDVDCLDFDGLEYAINLLAKQKPYYEYEIFKTRFGLATGKVITDETEILKACELENGISLEPSVPIPGIISATLNINVEPVIITWIQELTSINYSVYYNPESKLFIEDYFSDFDLDLSAEVMYNRIMMMGTILNIREIPATLELDSAALEKALGTLYQDEHDFITDLFGVYGRKVDADTLLKKHKLSEDEANELFRRALKKIQDVSDTFVSY